MDAEAIIGSAIQSARYNEAVVVNVNKSDDDTSEIVLVACLDHDNGGIVWKNANICGDVATDITSTTSNNTAATSYQEDIGIVRHLRTKRWVLPMLNDHRRNKLYNFAIRDAKKVVQRRIDSSGKEGEDSTIRILDIGSGTGLLAMMGARYTLDAIQEHQQQQVDDTSCEQSMKVNVTGVEMASAMARLGRMSIKENDLSNHIKIVEQHSTDSTFQIDDGRFFGEDIKGNNTNQPKADICTSELLESGLLGEGVLPAMRDAWIRHLKPDAIVVPKRACVYAVLVEGMPIKNNNGNGIQNNKETTLNAATAWS